MAKHPTHPATVHFPIAFTFLTGLLDAITYAAKTPATAGLVATAIKTTDVKLDPSIFPILSYYSTILTLFFSIPAVVSGALELMPVIKRDGFSSRKAQIGVLHALINDLATFGAAYNWWTRRDAVGFQTNDVNVYISSLLALPATFLAAYLGGELVFQYGMGIGRGSSSSKTKKSQ